jgi:polyphosphate kinase 2
MSDQEENNIILTERELSLLNSKKGFVELLKSKEYNLNKILEELHYMEELEQLNIEMVKLQNWILENHLKVLVIFEGRDAAGKGGTIKRMTEFLMPRYHRVVALPKPSEIEKGQWYFQRYIPHLPAKDEIVFFDRSWYNRAVVEPVNGFCTESQYELFISQVNDFEKMLMEDGIILFKFWLDITKEEQVKRLESRRTDPLKQWKIGPLDAKAIDIWDSYSAYIEVMLNKTSNSSPWLFVDANNKKKTRLECIRHLLNSMYYEGKRAVPINLLPDKKIIKAIEI